MKDNNDLENSVREFGFYKDGSFKMLGISFFLLLTLASSVAYSYYSYFIYTPPSNFIVLDEDFRVLEEVPLNEDVLTPDELSQWANDSVITILSYNYLNSDKHGSKINELFFKPAYKEFMNVFNNSRLLIKVKTQEAIVVPQIITPIKIDQEGVLSERKAWQLSGTIVLNIHGKSGLERQRLDVKMIIVRTSFKENSNGFLIQKVQLI
jgi:hypothetical protein